MHLLPHSLNTPHTDSLPVWRGFLATCTLIGLATLEQVCPDGGLVMTAAAGDVSVRTRPQPRTGDSTGREGDCIRDSREESLYKMKRSCGLSLLSSSTMTAKSWKKVGF